MKKELEQKIIVKSPKLFGNKSSFYFEIDDGWSQIILDLVGKLDKEIHRQEKAPDTLCANCYHEHRKHNEWDICELCEFDKEDCEKYIPLTTTVSQIKEKFGSLRFYCNNNTNDVYDMVNGAEILSQETCEVCGDTGKIYGPGWLKCLCEKHYKIKISAYESMRKKVDAGGTQNDLAGGAK